MNENPFIIILNEVLENRKILHQMMALQQEFISEKKEIFLSPEEARKMFQPPISKSTLLRWNDKKLVNRYIVGGRAVYKLSQIKEAIKTYQPYKRNKISKTI